MEAIEEDALLDGMVVPKEARGACTTEFQGTADSFRKVVILVAVAAVNAAESGVPIKCVNIDIDLPVTNYRVEVSSLQVYAPMKKMSWQEFAMPTQAATKEDAADVARRSDDNIMIMAAACTAPAVKYLGISADVITVPTWMGTRTRTYLVKLYPARQNLRLCK